MNVHAQLAAFLQKLELRLGDVPPERRQEIVKETRGHLEAMVAARRADGLDESAAWRSALDRFGDADIIGSELVREWNRAPRVETQGTPLSAREKKLKIAGVLALALLAYPLLLVCTPWLQARHLFGPLLLVLTPLMLLFNIGRLRKKGMPFTPNAICGLMLSFLWTLTMACRVQFAGQLRGTEIEALLNTYFSPLVIVLSLLILVWTRRQNKKVLPWRQSSLYASNPMAAEQEYRLSLSLGMVAGTVIPCIGMLWMGWQFFGMGYALVVCLGFVVLNFVIWRWQR